ncbi:hypothetical protein VPH35_020886 [Triticum aestivum]
MMPVQVTQPSSSGSSMKILIVVLFRFLLISSGADAEHPTIIPLYTSNTPQAPRGHTMRPRPYAIGHKVSSLLFETSLSTYETWLLPHAWTLHILRYNRDDHGGSKDQGQAWKRRRKKKQ